MTTPTTEAVAEQISIEVRAAMGRANASRRDLASKLGVDPMWVTRRLIGQTPFSVEDVVRIARALDADPKTLLAPVFAH